MGRHTVPGTGKPEPDPGFWVRLGVAVVLVALVGGYLLTRGDDTEVRTAGPATTSTPTDKAPTAGSPTPPPSTPPASPSSSSSPTETEDPPTLSFKVLRPSYITVRIPGGRTLVSRVFRKGEKRSFDQKRLEVVNGRPSAVRFTVNGTPRKPGPADRPESFTVRRR